MLLGDRIKELRKKQGLSQEELGKKINVTKVSICCYERNTRTPNLDTLLDLCEALNTSVSYILGQSILGVAEDEEDYKAYLDKDEIELIKELRKYKTLYYKLIAEPKRTLEFLEMQIK